MKSSESCTESTRASRSCLRLRILVTPLRFSVC